MKIWDIFKPTLKKKELESIAFFLGTINRCCDPHGISAVGYHTNIEGQIKILESYEKAGIVNIEKTPSSGPTPNTIKALLTDEGKELLQDFEEQEYFTEAAKEKINKMYGSEATL